MIPGINPRKMQQMMRKMGIQQSEIPAIEVIIRQEDKDLIISNPQVAKVNMMGQETLQITGDIQERTRETKVEISEEDIQTVVDQTGKEISMVKEFLEKNEGDLAKTIMELQDN